MVCCKVCKSRNTKHIGSKNNCLIHRCLDCSLVFVDPLPSDEELDFFYNNYHKSDQYNKKFKSKIRKAKFRLYFLKFFLSGRDFIDIGCNQGYAVEAARQMKFNACGSDVDNEAIDKASKDFPDCTFFHNSIEEIADKDKKYDLIYCSEVIEHVKDPVSFTKSLKKILKPKGIIFLTTPDIDHKSLPKDKSSLFETNFIRPPEHLYYFTIQSIELLFRNNKLSKNRFLKTRSPSIKLIARH